MFDLAFLPDSMSSGVFIGLVILSCFTSMLTAALGIGGGTLLLAVMAQVLPVKAIIPLHGVVQLGSNLGRSLVLLPNVRWDIFVYFGIGSVTGAILGGQIVVSLPVDFLRAVLGTFILISVWGDTFFKQFIQSQFANNKTLTIGGFISTLLTMFVGATGPFVIALIKAFNMPAPSLVATNAACLVLQHALKIIVFGFLGFIFTPYIPLIALMIASGFVGTLFGRKILFSVDEKRFKTGLNIILSILALRLLYSAAF